MTILIIKKENKKDWKNYKHLIRCNKIMAIILKFYWKNKGYEVEELEEEWQKGKQKEHPTEKN